MPESAQCAAGAAQGATGSYNAPRADAPEFTVQFFQARVPAYFIPTQVTTATVHSRPPVLSFNPELPESSHDTPLRSKFCNGYRVPVLRKDAQVFVSQPAHACKYVERGP